MLWRRRDCTSASSAFSSMGAQSAAERRAAEVELRALVTRFAPAHERLVGATRKWLLELLPFHGVAVLAALRALPAEVGADALVLVHDAARPNLHAHDISRLHDAAMTYADGAILAAPLRDTLKRADGDGNISMTEPRDGIWRALTPQAFRRDLLLRALETAHAAGVQVTDDAQAVERLGLHPRLVEGREDNLKVTTPADLALAEFLLTSHLPETYA